MEFIPDESLPVLKPEVRILVVDDREDNLFSIEAILERDGYTIVKANSGRAALKIILKQQDFTLILMDVQMPGMSGLETASLIYESERLKHIPIIFITAHDHSDENVFKGYQLGGVDYIYKPINPELLRVKVAVFVELYNKNQQMLFQEQKLIEANRNLEREIHDRKVSEEKVTQLNRQLIENINQLKATNEELERFAYVASHDLQEPLRKIILFSGRIRDQFSEPLGEEGSDLLVRMMRASERMQTLIRNLLSFSRSATDAGVFEEVDLNKLLAGVLSDVEMYIQQKNAIINFGDLPVIVVNSVQMRQVFQNIIINALKFSRQNTVPEISISAERVADNRHLNGSQDTHYKIYIRDNGIGFNMKYRDQIFMAFKRLHTQDQFEGTGIGLSICKKIVEKHHGHITAESEEGIGSTFILTLPAKQSVPLAVAT